MNEKWREVWLSLKEFGGKMLEAIKETASWAKKTAREKELDKKLKNAGEQCADLGRKAGKKAKDYVSNMDEKQKKRAAIGGVLLVVLFLIIVIIRGVTGPSESTRVAELLDLGNRYLEEADYESAVVTFDEAIAIDPKCEEAYVGKATAQCMLKDYEGAISTVEQGLAAVGESEMLLELRDWIEEKQEEELEEAGIDTRDRSYANGNSVQYMDELVLNYSYISRMTDTMDPEIQLMVINKENAENYNWATDNEEVATVTEDGLVTCQGQEGTAVIEVYGNNEHGTCIIEVGSGGTEYNEVAVEVPGSSGEDTYYIYIAYELEEEKAGVICQIGGNDFYTFAEYIYYSGDIEIPEALEIDGKEVPVTSLNSGIFEYSDGLRRIVIPASISSIGSSSPNYEGESLFSNCTGLEEIVVDEANEYYKSVDGVLYSKDGTELIAYPAAKEGGSYEIPAEVELVYPGAFRACHNLEEILVEDGNSFYESVDGVLVAKESGELLVYPSGRTETEYTIPDEVKSIQSKAFTDCSLKKVVLGDTVEWGMETFDNCMSLEEIDGTGSTERIWTYYWPGCDNLQKIRVGSQVTAIGVYGTNWETGRNYNVEIENLSELENLEELEIGGDAENISEIAGLSELQSLRIFGSEKFDFSMIKDLTNLTSLDIEDTNDLTLSDLSWISGLKNLEYLNLSVNTFDLADLSVLSELPNLQSIYIGSRETGENAGNAMSELRTQCKDLERAIQNVNIDAVRNN